MFGPLLLVPALLLQTTQAIPKGDIPLSKPEAKQILERYYRFIHGAKTLHYVQELIQGEGGFREELWLKGKYIHYTRNYLEKSSALSNVSMYFDANRCYDVHEKDRTFDIYGRYVISDNAFGMEPLLEDERPSYTLGSKVYRSTFEHKSAFRIILKPEDLPDESTSVVVDANTLVPVAWSRSSSVQTVMSRYLEFQIDKPIEDSLVKWSDSAHYALGFDGSANSKGMPFDRTATLARTDEALHRIEPYPIDSPRDRAWSLGNLYKEIGKDPAFVGRGYAGAGNCDMLQGYFDDAVQDFQEAGAAYKSSETQAKLYTDAKKAIRNLIRKEFRIEKLRQIPGSNLWVAALGKDDVDDPFDRIALYRFDVSRKSAKRIGPIKPTHDFFTRERCTLYLTHLSAKDPAWHVLVFTEWSGDCVPVYVQVYDLKSSGLKFVSELQSTSGMSIFGPTAQHGLTVRGCLDWKLDWSDVEEWDGRKFIFANNRHPELFETPGPIPSSGLEISDWPQFLEDACLFAIHKQFDKTRQCLTIAERLCAKRIQANPEHLEGDERGMDEPAKALALIRKRISWLNRRDYNHPLLYCPVADDLTERFR